MSATTHDLTSKATRRASADRERIILEQVPGWGKLAIELSKVARLRRELSDRWSLNDAAHEKAELAWKRRQDEAFRVGDAAALAEIRPAPPERNGPGYQRLYSDERQVEQRQVQLLSDNADAILRAIRAGAARLLGEATAIPLGELGPTVAALSKLQGLHREVLSAQNRCAQTRWDVGASPPIDLVAVIEATVDGGADALFPPHFERGHFDPVRTAAEPNPDEQDPSYDRS